MHTILAPSIETPQDTWKDTRISGDEILRVFMETMEQAAIIHDGHTILAANDRLNELLEIPPELTQPGCQIEEYIRFGDKRGDYQDGVGITLDTMRSRMRASQDYRTERQTPSGRILRIDNRFRNNLAVATYTDVTESRQRENLLNMTLGTMAQGLLVLEDEVVVAANPRVNELLGVPEKFTQPGTPWVELLQFRARRGDFGDRVQETLDYARSVSRRRKPHSHSQKAGDRMVLTENRFAHGMMFVTYTDVTDTLKREEKLRRSEAKVRQLAENDALTGLTNRRAFDSELTSRLHNYAALDGEKPEFALILIDLDRFKPVNDTYGHAIGDGLLRCIASRFRDVVRESDMLARIGGDEFAVLCDVSCESETTALARRIREVAAEPATIDGIELKVGASIGVAFPSADTRKPDKLLTAADLALYAAKQRGRARVACFEPEMADAAKMRQSLENDLRSALENDQILLHYQVQHDLKSSSAIGYEALMRWNHPVRGLVSPADFIPLAEETGTIVELGRWALLQACTDMASFDDSTRVAVNVSPVQFSDSDLLADVDHALAKSGLDPDRLEIEVTEQILIRDTEKTLETLQKLREMGVHLSMDDFGSGYSSLAYLTRFPFSKIKIDRSFIKDMTLDERSRTLVATILSLATSLDMKVTAEGVETDEQLALLTRADCHEVQGFLLGRPAPFGELRDAPSSRLPE